VRKSWSLMLIAATLLTGLFCFGYPLYKQEGNPLPLVSAALRLTFNNNNIEPISTDPEVYLAKTSLGSQSIISLMKSRGWHYQEQMGAGFLFANHGETAVVTSRQYSRYYQIYTMPPETRINPNTEVINLVATGDILMHNTVIASGLHGDTYNFEHLYAPIKDLVTAGDYASVNLETALAGPATGYTGYPLFNSPDSIATALQKAGFDLVVTANNHILDRGFPAAVRTMDVLRNAGLDTAGTHKSALEKQNYLIKDIRGVKVGYLAYSYSTNGIPVPADKPYFYDFLEPSKIKADIKAIRPMVDVLVLVLHWGVEYSPFPTEVQRQQAKDYFQTGADVILGSHPHVVQPMEIMKINGQDKFVIYSMGNSMGNQNGVERNSGVLFNLQFTKNFSQGITTFTGFEYTPLYIHPYSERGRQMFRVVPISDTIKAIQNGQDPYLGEESIPLLEKVLNDTNVTLHQLQS
jgi:poly-gamma-glutamate capsule biosynthesis protein CapA/YwtB (metallophosphatase superfamily)